MAAGGELHRIAHQVVDDLAQRPGVAQDGVRRVGLDVQVDLNALVVRGRGQQPHRALQGITQRKGRRRVALRVGLQAGEFEDVVDQRHQRGGRLIDDMAVAAVGGFGQRVFEQAHEALDGGQGGAQFVAHARQKVALGAVGALRFFGGDFQFPVLAAQGIQGAAQITGGLLDLLFEVALAALHRLAEVIDALSQLGQLITGGGPRPGAEITLPETGDGLRQSVDRGDHNSRQHQRHQQGGAQHAGADTDTADHDGVLCLLGLGQVQRHHDPAERLAGGVAGGGHGTGIVLHIPGARTNLPLQKQCIAHPHRSHAQRVAQIEAGV